MTQQTLDAFQVIADPNRRQILYLLSKDRLSINTLADNFDISRPAVSKHIKVLHEANFISIENSGRERYCILNQEGFNDIQKWMDYYDLFWSKKLKKLEQLLNAKTKKK